MMNGHDKQVVEVWHSSPVWCSSKYKDFSLLAAVIMHFLISISLVFFMSITELPTGIRLFHSGAVVIMQFSLIRLSLCTISGVFNFLTVVVTAGKLYVNIITLQALYLIWGQMCFYKMHLLYECDGKEAPSCSFVVDCWLSFTIFSHQIICQNQAVDAGVDSGFVQHVVFV